MGDFNAKVGEGREENVVGLHGLGISHIYINICTNNLIMGNTWFQQPTKRKWACKSLGDGSRNHINYILINERFRNVLLSAKTYPGADCYSNYVSVAAKFKVKF